MHAVRPGFPEDQRSAAARLYWAAFEAKLTRVLGPTPKALRFFEATLNPEHALSAVAADGDLLGVAGFKTASGAFVDADFSDLRAVFGLLGGVWRAGTLVLLERPVKDGVLLMDGVCVDEAARGLGVGTALLAAIKDEARARGCSSVRLDVIETNTRARALYERIGFVAHETYGIGPLRAVFGFKRATTMICEV